MKDSIAQQLADVIKNYEMQLQAAVKGNRERENALRWSKAHIPYEVIAPFMTAENLAELAQHKMSRWLLCGLSKHRLSHEDRFLFWEDVLSAGNALPAEWRAAIYLDCLRSSDNWTPRERNGRQPYYNCRNYDKTELADYVASSKWLVAAPLVRQWYCRLHKPGYELLSYIDRKREVNYPLREKLQKYLEEDDLPGFGLMYAMSGLNANWGLVRDILHNKSIRILKWLMDHDDSMFTTLKPYHLMVYAVANLPPKTAVRILECVERHCPGTVAATDDFGNNLLWYCLHNRKGSERDPMSALIAFLCRCGCRLDTQNYLGLSFRDICQVEPWNKSNMTFDDYKELVFHCLLQIHHCSVHRAQKLMCKYEEWLQTYFQEHHAPDAAASCILTGY